MLVPGLVAPCNIIFSSSQGNLVSPKRQSIPSRPYSATVDIMKTIST
jgi:hypothetical protein